MSDRFTEVEDHAVACLDEMDYLAGVAHHEPEWNSYSSEDRRRVQDDAIAGIPRHAQALGRHARRLAEELGPVGHELCRVAQNSPLRHIGTSTHAGILNLSQHVYGVIYMDLCVDGKFSPECPDADQIRVICGRLRCMTAAALEEIRVDAKRELILVRDAARDGQGVQTEERKSSVIAPKAFVFAKERNGYNLAGFGECGSVRSLKGLGIIARLIQTPGVPVPMAELAGANNDERLSGDNRSQQKTLDRDALRAIYEQLSEHKADLETAQENNDCASVTMAENAISRLQDQLEKDTGLAGRARDMNSECEKLRPQIHGTLKTVYEKLRKNCPPMNELASHFEGAISSESGAFVYRPAAAVPWNFSIPEKK